MWRGQSTLSCVARKFWIMASTTQEHTGGANHQASSKILPCCPRPCVHPTAPFQADPRIAGQYAASELTLVQQNGEDEEEEGTVKAPQPVRDPRFSLLHRLGWWATVILPLGTLVIITAIGFLAFLWSNRQSNPTWRIVMINGWATRAVSLTSALVRNAADMQAGIGVAMLAALALESFQVRLADAARVSSLRSGRSDPFDLLPSVVGSFKWNHGVLLTPTIILICTTFLMQFSSTVLLSDLSLGLLPGHAQSSTTSIELSYDVTGHYNPAMNWTTQTYQVQAPLIPRRPTWQRSPTAFQTFAEYSEGVDVQNGTSDTGKLLRAFLPFADAQSRESICNYTGKAMVLDSRVTCQRPVMDRLRVQFDWCSSGGPSYNPGGRTYQISGLVSPSVFTPKMVAASSPVHFSCQYLLGAGGYSLCQLQVPHPVWESNIVLAGNRAGGLVSEFADIDTSENYTLWTGPVSYGTAFLVFYSPASAAADTESSYLCSYDSGENPPMNASAHAEWFDAAFIPTNGSCKWPSADIGYRLKNAPCMTPPYVSSLNVSLCYTAWDAAVVPVHAYSHTNRSEPIADFNQSSSTYQFDEVRNQLNHSNGSTVSRDDRRILTLEDQDSWLPTPGDGLPFAWQPFVQNCGDIAGPVQQTLIEAGGSAKTSQMSGNQTILLMEERASSIGLGPDGDLYKFSIADGGQLPKDTFLADPTLSGLFLEIIADNGSLAQALSSVITVLSGMAYYDQFPQFSKSANTTQVFFTTVLYPQTCRGFVAFVGVLAVHLCVIAFVAVTFGSLSRYTLLGNDWMAFTQIFSLAGKEPFVERTLAKDTEIARALREVGGLEMLTVGIAVSGESGRVELIGQQRHRLKRGRKREGDEV